MPRKEIIDRIEKYVDPFRVTKGEDFKLTDFDPGVSSAAAPRGPNNHKSQTLGSAASIEEGLRQGDPDVRVVSKSRPEFRFISDERPARVKQTPARMETDRGLRKTGGKAVALRCKFKPNERQRGLSCVRSHRARL